MFEYNLPNSWKYIEKEVSFFSVYALSSFTFLINGLVLLIRYEKNDLIISQKILGIGLILQSVVSFLSDVVYLKRGSVFQIIDRWSALTNISWLLFNFSVFIWQEKLFIALSAAIALSLLSESRRSREKCDFDNYIFYHTIWHFVSPAFCIILMEFHEFHDKMLIF